MSTPNKWKRRSLKAQISTTSFSLKQQRVMKSSSSSSVGGDLGSLGTTLAPSHGMLAASSSSGDRSGRRLCSTPAVGSRNRFCCESRSVAVTAFSSMKVTVRSSRRPKWARIQAGSARGATAVSGTAFMGAASTGGAKNGTKAPERERLAALARCSAAAGSYTTRVSACGLLQPA
ncbi:uncharacterized protein LOC123442927 [Hordeum vulgare subsp. vulgare]|uniref:uncharacterized protein LOC123442927 n=1 Tax=Hordeum vulgare subsp. vulgare TaxID=112509 RepID=UPI001D1A39F1|nr:uncharacterized protein LOC123442927 [Hordeum vulgare subsp. vulgare]